MRFNLIVRALLLSATLSVALMGFAPAARAVTIFALTDHNALISFDSTSPGVLTGVGPINLNDDLIGIDFRPATNELYAVSKFGRAHTLQLDTGLIFTETLMIADPSDPTNPYAGLRGSRFGFDFDPVSDRLRLTSDTGQNLRVNVSPHPDPALVTTDSNVTVQGGGTALVVGIAYSNNVPGTPSTRLYGIDSGAGGHRLVQFVGSPDDGIVAPVGPLGINNSSLVGFDIYNIGQINVGVAAFQREEVGISELYTIDLTTGGATLVGTIGGGADGRGAGPSLESIAGRPAQPGRRAHFRKFI